MAHEEIDIALDNADEFRAALFGGATPKNPPPEDGEKGEKKGKKKGKSTEQTESNPDEDRLRGELMGSATPKASGGADDADDALAEFDVGTLDITQQEDAQKLNEKDIELFLQNPLVLEAIEQGVDLREYARQIEDDLRVVEKESIDDYVHEEGNLRSLHEQIDECDAILEKMETLLSGFQTDLGNISADIKTLQDDSLGMQNKLRNRKLLGLKLGEYVTNAVVPPQLVEAICEAPLGSSYIPYLQELDLKIAYNESDEAQKTAAAAETAELLSNLIFKAATRIREFLLEKIYALRKPKTNIQTRQQHLLKYKYMMEFVSIHAREVAVEIRSTYADTLGNIFFTYMKTRIATLMKLEEVVAEKSDVLTADETTTKGFFNAKVRNRGAVFCLNGRDAVLDSVDNAAEEIIAHVAAAEKTKYPYEVLFRSLQGLLMDTATSEYLFTLGFFGKTGSLFSAMFERTISLFMQHVDDHANKSFDTIGLLLCIRINYLHQLVMTKRRVPALDSFLDSINMILWPRVKMLMDLHIEAVDAAATQRTLQRGDVHAHFLTRRFAEYMTAILTVNVGPNATTLTMTLSRLTNAFNRLLTRLADSLRDPRARQVFLINNYDLILMMLYERVPDAPEVETFRVILDSHANAFVEELLTAQFNGIIEFVDRVEPRLEGLDAAAKEKLGSDGELGPVEELVRDFGENWLTRVQRFEQEVVTTFDNMDNRADILLRLISALTDRYDRFTAIVHECFRHPSWANEIVDRHQVLKECRNIANKYRDQ